MLIVKNWEMTEKHKNTQNNQIHPKITVGNVLATSFHFIFPK